MSALSLITVALVCVPLALISSVLITVLPQRILHDHECWLAEARDQLAPTSPPMRALFLTALQQKSLLLILWALIVLLATLLMTLRQPSWDALSWGLFLWLILTAALTDARTQLLPDVLTLPTLWLGLLLQSFDPLKTVGSSLAIWGAALGYLSLKLLDGLHVWRRGVNGVGQGDMKLLAAIGAWFGPSPLPILMVMACLLTISFFLIGRITGRPQSSSKEFAFGPSMAIAAVIYFFAYWTGHARLLV